MHEVSFLLETITPLFMGGADGKSVELRPSAFKGMMRFWWRAIRADSDIERLWKDEARIFGAADEKIGRSRVKVTLVPFKIDIGKSLWEEIPFEQKPRKKGGYYKNPTKYLGLSYVLYSTFRHEKNIKPFLKPNSKFIIQLASNDKKALKNAICAFWCLIYFGGIGTRSRRGGGNLAVIDVEDKGKVVEEIDIGFKLHSLKDKVHLRNWIEKNYNQIKNIVESSNKKPQKYSSLIGAQFYILSPKKDWKDALDKIGEIYQKFRKSNKSSLFVGPHFGMPVIHRRGEVRLVPYNKDGKRISERRASPLIFKLIKAQNLFFPVILWLSGDIVYKGKIVEEKKPWPREIEKQQEIAKQKDKYQFENHGIIRQFLKNFTNYEHLIL